MILVDLQSEKSGAPQSSSRTIAGKAGRCREYGDSETVSSPAEPLVDLTALTGVLRMLCPIVVGRKVSSACAPGCAGGQGFR